jgi:hypothetical protein
VLFGQAFLVFTFSDGKVVRWRDYRARAAAVPTAGASVPDWMAGARYEIIGSGRKEEIRTVAGMPDTRMVPRQARGSEPGR